ncbi:MAG: transglutaminase family protein [Bacteroidota bacterium]|nr:transglutaminase family protein [Bacteroidota bacterium]
MNDSKLKALINLLDDPDENVYSRVHDKIMHTGIEAIPFLEARYGLDNNPLMNERLEILMENLRNRSFIDEFQRWWDNEEQDVLLKGLFYVNSLYYPDTSLEDFKEKIEIVTGKIWLELSENLTGFETIKIINRNVFILLGFSVLPVKKTQNKAPYFPEYLFINKKLSPYPFVGMYCLFANKMDLPVYPVYLPNLILMGYHNKDVARVAYGESTTGVLFYINPYDAGSFLGRKALEYVVKQRNIDAEEKHYKTIDSKTFIHKYLRYLWDMNVFSPDNPSFSKLENMLLTIRKEKK